MLLLTTKGTEFGCQRCCRYIYSDFYSSVKLIQFWPSTGDIETFQLIRSWKETAWDHKHLLLILGSFREEFCLFTLFNALLNLDKLSVGNKSMWKVFHSITCDGKKENGNNLGKRYCCFLRGVCQSFVRCIPSISIDWDIHSGMSQKGCL